MKWKYHGSLINVSLSYTHDSLNLSELQVYGSTQNRPIQFNSIQYINQVELKSVDKDLRIDLN